MRAVATGRHPPAAVLRALTLDSASNHNATLFFPTCHAPGELKMRASPIVDRKSYRIGLTLVAAAVVGLYGCGKEEPKQAPAAPAATAPAAAAPAAAETVTVKIGHAGPLTGGIAHLGNDDENGVHLAVDEANAKKLKIGGKTVTFEMMSE